MRMKLFSIPAFQDFSRIEFTVTNTPLLHHSSTPSHKMKFSGRLFIFSISAQVLSSKMNENVLKSSISAIIGNAFL